MNIIIPVAGIGKRLRPHTYSTPKALLMVGGKPLLGHILDKFKQGEDSSLFTPPKKQLKGKVDTSCFKVIFIIGYMGDKIKEYVGENYEFDTVYIEQKEQLGLGHAIWLTREVAANEPCIIVYGDTIFEGNIPIKDIPAFGTMPLKTTLPREVNGLIGTKEVPDPRRLGIVETDGNYISRFVEKPEHPTTNLAIIGVNFINNTQLLFEALDFIITKEKKTAGEFQLTDAFELMLEKGAKFKWFTIEGWYDCGTFDTLLSTNRALLAKTYTQPTTYEPNTTIILPTFIHNSANIEHSIIGPNVSIDKNAHIKGSIVFDSIINEGAVVENCRLYHSIIGANAVVKGVSGELNIGAYSVVGFI